MADDSFDLVVTIFGAMFAPDPFAVAAEMVRVTKPGGRIVMGNWIPGDPTLVAQILKISAAYAPPPPEGFVSPVTWGSRGARGRAVRRRRRAGVAGHAASAPPTRSSTRVRRPAWSTTSAPYYGPTMNAFAAAEKDGRVDDAAARARVELFTEQNTSGTDDTTVIPATFLRVTVTV